MILVDATVLVDYLRHGDAALLALMQAHGAALCGVTRAGILRGARGPKHRLKLLQFLNMFPLVSLVDGDWDEIGDNLAGLRVSGVTVPWPDVILATMAMLLDVELWARDQHFPLMQRALPSLTLFQEPP